MHVVPRYDEKIITWVQQEAEQDKIDEIINKAKDLF
jgi:hypothetical protein